MCALSNPRAFAGRGVSRPFTDDRPHRHAVGDGTPREHRLGRSHVGLASARRGL